MWNIRVRRQIGSGDGSSAGLNNFFRDTIGGAWNCSTYHIFMAVALYIGIANLIGLLGFKPPTKDMNVTVALVR